MAKRKTGRKKGAKPGGSRAKRRSTARGGSKKKTTRAAAKKKSTTRRSPGSAKPRASGRSKASGKKRGGRKSKKKKSAAAAKRYRQTKLARLLRRLEPRTGHKKAPKIFTTTHKIRGEWFRNRAAWPYREAPTWRLVQERRRANHELPDEPGNAQWVSVGPTNIGGRMTSIVCDPADPDRILAGAAGGGIWASDDGGLNWNSLWHSQDSLNIGSLAIDPNDSQVIYCGTGEANLSADSYPGAGVFRSTDGGTSWHRLASPRCDGVPIRIGALAIDPSDSDHIMLGGVGHHFDKELESGGLYISRDAGQTWLRQSFVSAFNYWCHGIVFDPVNPAVVFATITEQGISNGIWRSQDGGATWQQLRNGLPDPDRFGRASLAVAPSNPDIVYAIAADRDSGVLGVYRSSNGGTNWTEIGGAHFNNERQMSYNNCIVVHPQDEDHIICGGVDLHRTTDGGQSWTQVTHWNANRGEPDYAHADHHALLMPAAVPGRIYDMNDGGMDVSEDGGETWENRSLGLAVTMYYDLDVAQSNSNFFGGGAQDNGTPITVSGRPDDHFDITGGDGGWLVFDRNNAVHIYASVYNMFMFRFRQPEGWTEVTPPELASIRNALWMVPITMDPNDSDTVFTGSIRVWRTTNDADNWRAVSGNLDGSVITAISVSLTDSNRIYVGTNNGGFFRSTDGGNNWSGNLAGAVLPGRIITRILTAADHEDWILVTVGGFGHSHLFRSTDGGSSWEDIDNGVLPDAPHHSLAGPTARADEVYVGTDAGVFVSHDFGDSWRTLTRNLPNVSVVDLVYHDARGELTAATYGRSLWRVDIEG